MKKTRSNLQGGNGKNIVYKPARILRKDGHNLLFRIMESSNGEAIELLGFVPDSHIGEFEGHSFMHEKGRWVSEVPSPQHEDDSHLFSYAGPDRTELKVPDSKPKPVVEMEKALKTLDHGPVNEPGYWP